MTIDTSCCDVVVVILILCCLAGCDRGEEKAAPAKPQIQIHYQILASRQHDAKIVLAAEKEKEMLVRIDGNVVARWVELGVEELDGDKDAVVQADKEKKKRLLVLVGKNDLSEKHFEHLSAATVDGKPAVSVQLTDEGIRRIRDLTEVKNRGRRVGVIIDGKLRAQVTILSNISDRITLLPGKYSAKEVEAIIKAFGR